MIAPFIHN